MSSVWYDKALTKIGRGLLDLSSLTNPKIIAIEENLYVFTQGHEFLSDVPAGARLSIAALTNAVFGVTDGWLDGDDVTFTAPTADKVVKSLIIYDDSGTEATSPLLLFIDEANILPITTEASKDLEIIWQGISIARL